MLQRSFVALGVAAVCALATTSASAVTYDFIRISANSADLGTAAHIKMDVTDAGGGLVDFKFYWSSAYTGSISEIYFDDGTLLLLSTIDNNGGAPTVAFTRDADDPVSPGELPEANNFMIGVAGPYEFLTTASFLADADAGNANAVQFDEFVTIRFSLTGGGLAGVLAALNNPWGTDGDGNGRIENNMGGLVVGIHVRGQSDGESDSFINTLIPLPMTFGLGMAGLAPLALRRRRTI